MAWWLLELQFDCSICGISMIGQMNLSEEAW